MKVAVAGGLGALGRRVADHFAECGVDVVILSRSPRPEICHRQVEWDGKTVGPWRSELEGAVVVNLAGKLVDCRPTPRNVALLASSRVEPTHALVAAATRCSVRPVLWLQMSTTGHTGVPTSPPTPKPLVRMGACAMRSDAALALLGRRGIPGRLLDSGFEFEFATFDDAVDELVGRAA